MADYAYDFSIVPGPDPLVLARVGAKGMLGYSFGARQSDDYLARVRALGMTVVWIWERDTDSIFNGYAYAISECRFHEQRALPGELTYVACDTNDGGVAGRLLSPFLSGWSNTTREAVFGVYGSSGAIRQAQMFGGKCQRFWGVVNWIDGGGPDNAPENIRYWAEHGAHLIQLIGSDIPDTDQNLILKPDWGTIGAAAPEEDDVKPLFITKRSDTSVGIWITDRIYRRHVLPDEWAIENALAQLAGNPPPGVAAISDQYWDSLPVAGAVGGGTASSYHLALTGSASPN